MAFPSHVWCVIVTQRLFCFAGVPCVMWEHLMDYGHKQVITDLIDVRSDAVESTNPRMLYGWICAH